MANNSARVVHAFTSTKPSSIDATRVDGPKWNADHVLTGLENVANVDTTNASNITSGTLPAAQLPTPTASTLGGVKSLANVSHNWINSIGTDGTPTQTQPAFSDISGTIAATQLPNPSATTLGGIESLAAVSHQWINTISTSGVPSSTQPAFTDISGTIAAAQITALPSAVFANPTGTIGLTTVNGSATTALRSDGAPALSQSIAPTWSGLHTYTAGELFTGSPPISGTWHWGGDVSAKFHWSTSGGTTAGGVDAASNTLPEFVAQMGMTSATGSANAATAYKVTFSPWMIANSGSANSYAFNPVFQAGTSFNKIGTAGEFDINNNSGTNHNFTNLGTSSNQHGIAIVSGGSSDPAAAVWITNGGAGKFANGIAITGALSTTDAGNAAFQATAGGYGFARALGSWVNGVNFFGATITGGLGAAFISPNNVGFGASNAAGNALIPLINLDGSNKSQYGSTSVIEHVFNVNPGGATPAILVTNSHATAGDQGIVIAAGSTGTADTTTLYVSFNTSDNLNQAGGIVRADSAGVRHVTYNTASDERRKKSRGLVDDALDRIDQIDIHKYVGPDYEGDDYSIGYFAQNLYRAFPDAVTRGGDDVQRDPWKVDYGRTAPLAMAGVKELRKIICELSAEVAELKAIVARFAGGTAGN